MLVYLIRHGETIWNKESRYQGTKDIPLSQEGMAKLKKADFSPEHLYVTPLMRTQQTAQIIFPQSRQVVSDGLREMNFGDFEGRSYKEMEHDAAYREWVDSMCLSGCPNGEARGEFSDRVVNSFSEIMTQELEKKSPYVVIVAHGGTMMALLDRCGTPVKDYWDWLTPNGCGYIADADEWEEKKILKVRKEISFSCSN